jgi:hypothetical protein
MPLSNRKMEATMTEFPPPATNSLRSFNFPDRFVRHQNFLAELQPINAADDLAKKDATFVIGAGNADPNGISFQSVNFPGFNLRHQDFRLKLQQPPPEVFLPPEPGAPPSFTSTLTPESQAELDLFNQDTTFFIQPGLADNSKASFRSLNFPQRFLRHKNFHLVLDELDPNNEVDIKDATFEIAGGFV